MGVSVFAKPFAPSEIQDHAQTKPRTGVLTYSTKFDNRFDGASDVCRNRVEAEILRSIGFAVSDGRRYTVEVFLPEYVADPLTGIHEWHGAALVLLADPGQCEMLEYCSYDRVMPDRLIWAVPQGDNKEFAPVKFAGNAFRVSAWQRVV